MKSKILSILCLACGIATLDVQAGSIVVANDSTAASLDVKGARRIFLGREQTVGDKSTIVVFQKSGATKDSFEKDVLGRSGANLKSYWSRLVFTGRSKAPQEVENDAEVIAKVTSTPGAIGYVSDSAVNDSVKVLLNF